MARSLKSDPLFAITTENKPQFIAINGYLTSTNPAVKVPSETIATALDNLANAAVAKAALEANGRADCNAATKQQLKTQITAAQVGGVAYMLGQYRHLTNM